MAHKASCTCSTCLAASLVEQGKAKCKTCHGALIVPNRAIGLADWKACPECRPKQGNAQAKCVCGRHASPTCGKFVAAIHRRQRSSNTIERCDNKLDSGWLCGHYEACHAPADHQAAEQEKV